VLLEVLELIWYPGLGCCLLASVEQHREDEDR
jgi:hypothetical protein